MCYQQREAVSHGTALYITKMGKKKMNLDSKASIYSAYMRKTKLLYRYFTDFLIITEFFLRELLTEQESRIWKLVCKL